MVDYCDAGGQIELQVIRGDLWRISVGLDDKWVDQVASPEDYSISIVFREFQDDRLVPYITVAGSPLRPAEDGEAEGAVLMSDFLMTPAETQSLPDFEIVAYCEVVEVATNTPTRLFDAVVEMRD